MRPGRELGGGGVCDNRRLSGRFASRTTGSPNTRNSPLQSARPDNKYEEREVAAVIKISLPKNRLYIRLEGYFQEDEARLAADHCGANASLWQTAAIGLRSLIDCDWTLLRTSAVATIIGVTW